MNPALRFDIFTLFPGIFTGFLAESLLKRAQERGLIQVALHDIRQYAAGPHRVCDDTPYGGGGGMVLKPEPVFAAVESVLGSPPPAAAAPIILLTPQGRVFSQALAAELSQRPRLAFICGRYEGVDERIRQGLATDEISVGDYVLSGGEVAAMVVMEAVSRLVPGFLGFADGARQDSHARPMQGLLEGPQYTRPLAFRGMAVPDVLLSGHHARVDQWRREQALLRTAQRRPDLLPRAALDERERQFLRSRGYDPDAPSPGRVDVR